jgi:hypothetical protein
MAACSSAASSGDTEPATVPGDNAQHVDEESLRLVDAVGDCSGVRARFVIDRRFVGLVDHDPCGPTGPTGTSEHLIDSLVERADRLGQWRDLDQVTGGAYSLIREVGGCDDTLFDVRDDFLGATYALYPDDSCTWLDRSVADSVASQVVHRHLATGALLIPVEPDSFFERRCDYTVTPADYEHTLSALPSTSRYWRTVCFSGPGSYEHPIRLEGVDNLILRGEQGSVVRSSVAASDELLADGRGATVEIVGGDNLVVSAMTIENSSESDSAGTAFGAVSRAVSIRDVDNALIRDSDIGSTGKQTVFLQRVNSAVFQRVDVAGGYFVLDVRDSNVVVDESSLTQSRPPDDHSMLWTETSNLFIRSTHLSPLSGRGLLSGTNLLSNNIRVEDVSSNPVLDAWIQQHPNYRNIRLWLYGSYPSQTADFFENLYQGGGPSPGSVIYRVGPDGRSEETSSPSGA